MAEVAGCCWDEDMEEDMEEEVGDGVGRPSPAVELGAAAVGEDIRAQPSTLPPPLPPPTAEAAAAAAATDMEEAVRAAIWLVMAAGELAEAPVGMKGIDICP